ncbi:SAM-dependent methyltransferase [Dactylosporangium sp. AC04546]|uniref:methyltransferase domain-containing protein n=1 Tax=Dactylosporangium sp. AC04546 TaxID=2862460 RepID=UPI001EDE1204|nr:class I SAM-dependent methyltransferase [Dactylosporangium sp. AC04546]WVK83099.1 SAM-dependent methyltransferase [Dactylosporangium sp. AC04546]
MRTDYAEVFQSDAAVDKYERVVYAPETYSTAVSVRQRAFLRRLVRREFTARRPVQHDFACGTGRAIKLLHGVVRAAHGYDVSAQMLAKAREAGVYAKLHQVGADGPVPEPATVDGPALVTVFRLLLNAPKDVRDRAIAFAARILPESDSGLLVVENHGNRSSLRHLRHRRNRDNTWFAELHHAEVEQLLARHGFEVIDRRGFAVLPAGAYRRDWLRPMARRADDLATRSARLSAVATDVLYVARRIPS